MPTLLTRAFLAALALSSAAAALVAAQETEDAFSSATFSGLPFRSIGPALTSGRIADIAVDPRNEKTYYLAVASGGVFKTENAGTTWTPIFDDQPSYSIGAIAIDPGDSLVVWVGTGENNSQRSVSYGDGVYKSVDAGRTWKNVGLKTSEHIGKILVDPRDSNVVYVASQGPLWNPGGERGLFKTTDGGKTWSAVLQVSENTGVNDVVLDPRNPDVLIASSYQRRRHVWTLINGGPESAIYKSRDGGTSWEKLARGLPKGDVGRIGLARSQSAPDVVYAIVEAAEDGGFYRSIDGGENWEKRSDYVSGGPQYYNEIVVDPRDPDRVYSMDTWMMVTEDGGKTFARAGETFKHVDNHALWIDPNDSDHLIAGCDGGVYESFDRARTWDFKANLPITQFYRVEVDNDLPFYNVYGGTQDNFSLGGPSRTTSGHGILNSDWFVTRGGDGFETVIDPLDPNILYAQSQHGGLVRFDRRSGEEIYLKPQPAGGEPALRWNWDSPLILSPHSPTRLYFAANRLFRSDDRGNTWRAVSPDLTAQIDRNELPVMGKVWSVDAVAKNTSTSFYGNIVSLSESRLKEGLLYTGTDDGLVQVTDDGGLAWARTELPRAVPERTYVSRIEASSHDLDTVYAAFDNHKNGDFAPYLFKSTDRGGSWTSISGDLPSRGPVYVLAEDRVDPNLLFAGTETGVFFSSDGGKRWVQLKGGLPTIAVRDIAIQERENDLVLATFGRGFYILDDFSLLRGLGAAALENEAVLFPVKKSWMYMERLPLGLPGKSFQGDSFYAADNPPFGATVTYYLKEDLLSRKKKRQEEEKRIEGEGGTIRYPDWDALRSEDREEPPAIWVTVKDASGDVVRRMEGPATKGFHRVAWDFRFPDSRPARLKEEPRDNPFAPPPIGPMAVPGTYEVSLASRVDGVVTPLGEPQRFEAQALGTASLPAEDKQALLQFQQETAALQRAVLGSVRLVEDTDARLALIEKAILQSPVLDQSLLDQARNLRDRLHAIDVSLSGDETIRSRSEPTPPSIEDRVDDVVYGHWTSTSAPTETQREAFRIAGAELAPVLDDLRRLIETDLAALEETLDARGAPWTPGRIPRWPLR
jgi:photosystem II stability/assembly factor-like uncharacterized protein